MRRKARSVGGAQHNTTRYVAPFWHRDNAREAVANSPRREALRASLLEVCVAFCGQACYRASCGGLHYVTRVEVRFAPSAASRLLQLQAAASAGRSHRREARGFEESNARKRRLAQYRASPSKGLLSALTFMYFDSGCE